MESVTWHPLKVTGYSPKVCRISISSPFDIRIFWNLINLNKKAEMRVTLLMSLCSLLCWTVGARLHHLGYISNGLVHRLTLNNKILLPDLSRLFPVPTRRYYGGDNSKVTWISGSLGLNGGPRPSPLWIKTLVWHSPATAGQARLHFG